MHTQTSTAALAVNGKVTPAPKVRLIVEADIPALIAYGFDMHQETGLMRFSRKRVAETLYKALKRDGVVVGAIGPVGNPEAAICMMIGQFWYSDQPHLEEVFDYVRPEFRRSNYAKTLINYAKQCADEFKVPLLIGIISHQRTEAKIRLYRRLLGEPAGAYFLYNGKTGA